LHTAEHLLTAALQRRLPAMSNYTSRFKSRKCVFQFDHPEPVPPEIIAQVEREIREIIARQVPVQESLRPRGQAGDLPNLHQVPEEADPVRVVQVGPYDARACSGAHVAHTGEIRDFRVASFRQVGPNRYRVNIVVG
jgi:alanyl-tRNA synthetase